MSSHRPCAKNCYKACFYLACAHVFMYVCMYVCLYVSGSLAQTTAPVDKRHYALCGRRANRRWYRARRWCQHRLRKHRPEIFVAHGIFEPHCCCYRAQRSTIRCCNTRTPCCVNNTMLHHQNALLHYSSLYLANETACHEVDDETDR